MAVLDTLAQGVSQGLKQLYDLDLQSDQISFQPTRKEFEGDFTLVVFPYTRQAKKKPEEIGKELGTFLAQHQPEVSDFNVIKGFLNLQLEDRFWKSYLADHYQNETFGYQPANGRKVMVEYSSPNTNKPLHLGHIRNILLGWASAKVLEAAGFEVVKVQIINDRGIAICKSMLAWQKYGAGASPKSTGKKADHFVGEYYVLFEKKFQEEYKAWQTTAVANSLFEEKAKKDQSQEAFFKAFKNTYFNDYSELGREARDMLLDWEAGKKETFTLWQKMNNWVYEGFDETYERLGVTFDKVYYESDTYLYGKDIVQEGLESDVFYRKRDGSVWCDLEDVRLDQKIVLRSDGTSVYMTQDLGTARMRYDDFGVEKMVYVVGDEQNYHFQVLFEILKKLEEPYADGLFHLSYGMVDLPTGKMKSREGTVVDADDLIDEVEAEARQNSKERDTLDGLSKKEQDKIISQIGLGALKFFIVKVHPKKRMVFDPKESVDLQGQTGPYVQNAYVRIQSVFRNAKAIDWEAASDYHELQEGERDLIRRLHAFDQVILEAAEELDPSTIANYCYDLAKSYHRFWHDYSILKAETESAKAFRLQLSRLVGITLRNGMNLLGIEMPDRM